MFRRDAESRLSIKEIWFSLICWYERIVKKGNRIEDRNGYNTGFFDAKGSWTGFEGR